MRNKVATATIAALAVWTAGCEKKQDEPKVESSAKREARWEKADANRDGKLSRAEAATGATQGLSTNFDKIDANKDGFLTREERDRFIAAKAKK
jgi:hypothetical protein